MGKKSSHKGKKQYGLYQTEGRMRKNKIKRLERRVRQNPNDTGAKKALDEWKKSATSYKRKKPNSRVWRGVSDVMVVDSKTTIIRNLGHKAAIEYVRIRAEIKKHLNKLKYDKAENSRPRLVDVDPNLNMLMHMSNGNKSRKKKT